MTTSDPLSLTQVKRLAASVDTIRLRASRSADLETPIGAFLRLDDGGPLLPSRRGREPWPLQLPGIGPGGARGARRMARVQTGPSRSSGTTPSCRHHLKDDHPRRVAHLLPRRRVEPTEGMPRFSGGAVGALAYDAVTTFEPTVPLPDADPVGVPLAAFLETDLVLVFDHLSHELSAIASLHTDAPNLEARYRIAEAAVFEALERTARPSPAELVDARGRVGQRLLA
jgi:anthranilate synthase component 1